MAARPKTAAEIAEANGELNSPDFLESISIGTLANRMCDLHARVSDINRRLGWIVSSVRATYYTSEAKDLDVSPEVLERLHQLSELSLKVDDILSGNADTELE